MCHLHYINGLLDISHLSFIGYNDSDLVRPYACISRLCSCDLDLDPMTLTWELDVDIPKMYLHTKRFWLKTFKS